MTIAQLQSRQTDNVPSIWRKLEIATLTRAFFMIFIVAEHADAFYYSQNWGAAYFLIILAGYSVARFQLPEIIRSGSVMTLLGTIRFVAIPTILTDVVLELLIRKFEAPSLFLVSNFQDPHNIQGYTFYFIEFYVQLLLIAALLFSIPRVRAAFQSRPMLSAILLFLAFVAVDRTIESIWNGDYNYHRTPWHYGWCFALGMVIAAAKDLRAKLFALGMVIVSVLTVWEFTSAAYYVAGGCTLLLFVRSVLVPAPVKTILAEIAGASMFIYLAHYELLSVVNKVFGAPQPWLSLILSIVVGVIGAHVYIWLERIALQLWRRHRTSLTGGSDKGTPQSPAV